ncbi:Uncharacterized protein CK203_013270 [Vitis vinifera]|uniref:DNA/RNA-binding protein Alba-like domain-containing protein n=1 Tax=Vitis vinifera TaxID=29760 RepID=A0A438JQ65_VITVI|nr:Uncharacterized protein CK203_013270 [Vitis vinifera]
MEEITEGVNSMNIADSHKKNRIQVSNTKKPLFSMLISPRYVFIYFFNFVCLSMFCHMLCLVAEILVARVFHLLYYCNVGLQRYMQQHNEVELSALGMAIATVVTIAEILKNNGLAVEKKIMTSTVDMKDESRGRPIQKAKIEILLGKTENFDELMAAAAEEREAGDVEEQQS